MHEILFRGKRKDNYEWCEGFYAHYGKKHYIIEMVNDLVVNWHEVYPETVGQYTGLNDKDGKRIFEGDVLCGAGIPKAVAVEFTEGGFVAGCLFLSQWLWDGKNGNIRLDEVEVIGNIHDKPGLMEVT